MRFLITKPFPSLFEQNNSQMYGMTDWLKTDAKISVILMDSYSVKHNLSVNAFG